MSNEDQTCLDMIQISTLKLLKLNPDLMVEGKKEITNVKDVLQKCNTSLNNLSTKIRKHGRHAMLSFLSSLPIPVIRILDIEVNRFCNRNHQMYEATLLTKCGTQHALCPLIDSEINNKRNFIIIPVIDKGIDFR